METINENRWQSLKTELIERFEDPKKSPEFVIYFWLVIFLAGLVGMGLTFVVEFKLAHENPCHPFSHIHLNLAIASYFIALLTASASDLILSSKKNPHNNKSLSMIGIGSIILGLCLLGAVIVTEELPILEYCLSLVGLILSFYIWWISNAHNPNLAPSSFDEKVKNEVNNLKMAIE